MFKKSCLILGLALLSWGGVSAHAKTVRPQHHPIVKPRPHKTSAPKKPRVKIINNANLKVHNTGAYATGYPLDFISSVRGNNPMNFGTNLTLPGNWTAPQSMAMTPDGKYAYVLYNANGDYNDPSRDSFIVKYQIPGTGQFNPHDTNIVKTGPVFKTGLTKSIAYNSNRKQLVVSSKGGRQLSLQQIDPNQLTVQRRLSVSAPRKQVTFNPTITFDSTGHLYATAQSNGKIAPRNSILLYRGTISHAHASLKPLNVALRHTPGTKNQALAYNYRQHTIALASDDAIIQIPVQHLNRVRPGNLRTTIFNSRREFKGLAFDRSHNAYLLLNRAPEIMRASHVR